MEYTVQRLTGFDQQALMQVDADFPDRHWPPENAAAFLEDQNNFLIVSKCEARTIGVLIGYRLARLDNQNAQVLLYEIDVHQDFRQQGVATAMLEKLKELARKAGASEIWAVANKSNAAAMGLYRVTGGIAKHDDDIVFEYRL